MTYFVRISCILNLTLRLFFNWEQEKVSEEWWSPELCKYDHKETKNSWNVLSFYYVLDIVLRVWYALTHSFSCSNSGDRCYYYSGGNWGTVVLKLLFKVIESVRGGVWIWAGSLDPNHYYSITSLSIALTFFRNMMGAEIWSFLFMDKLLEPRTVPDT